MLGGGWILSTNDTGTIRYQNWTKQAKLLVSYLTEYEKQCKLCRTFKVKLLEANGGFPQDLGLVKDFLKEGHNTLT